MVKRRSSKRNSWMLVKMPPRSRAPVEEREPALDVDGFIARELVDRKALGYPPYARVVLLRIDATDEQAAREAGRRLGDLAREVAEPGVLVLGPAPAPAIDVDPVQLL